MQKLRSYRIHTLLMAMLLPLAAMAQERITFLDWDELVRDTVYPVYSEIVPLETDYRCNDYTITLEYPTWADLTPAEMELARRVEGVISDSICIDMYVSVDRGIGYLNYSFLPFIYKDGTIKKLVSAKVLIKPSERVSQGRNVARSGTESRYARKSVLASGVWRKIHITRDGMYRLTPQFLASMGFSNPDVVHLYGYGGHQQHEVIDADNDFDDLEEVPLYKHSDGSLLFWGNGLLRWEGTERVFNAYANKATYFLTEGDYRQEMKTGEEYSGSVRQTVSTTLGHALHEVDDFAWFRGGRNLVEGAVYSGSASRTYQLHGINSLGDEKLTVVFTGTDVSTPLTVWANGVQVLVKTISAPGSYMYYSEGRYANVDASGCNIGNESNTWNMTLATQGPFATSSSVQGRLDYIALNFTAPLSLQNGYVRFGGGYEGTGKGTGNSTQVTRRYSGPTRFVSIGGADAASVKVMRIGRRNNPATLMPIRQENGGATFSVADGTDDFVAFNPWHQFPEPEMGGHVANQNLHSIGPVDMVIIVPASGKLTGEAYRLAQAHRDYSNLSCVVVSADQIYNEFSSGTPDATAYRRFMKMLYDRGIAQDSAPRYLLLMGDCAWDNRMISVNWRSFSPDDYLLCNQSENSYSDTQSYCWEDYFGLMDDGEGGRPTKDVSDIGIGRFPVTTEAQAKIMVDKVIAHLQHANAAEWRNKVVVMGDDGDQNIHMTDALKVADAISANAPDVDITRLMWDNYSRVNQGLYYSYPEIRSVIDRQIKKGVMFMNYTGHGATYLMSHERVITLDDMRAWKSDKLPLWFVAACDITPFDSQEENLGEAAVLNEGGAAVAFIGTTRTVYSSQNFYLNRFFSQSLFKKNADGSVNSVGDALREAKRNMVATSVDGAQAQNKLQYALLGDPALTFGNPMWKVVLDSIDGTVIGEEIYVKGGSRVRFSGHIEKSGGDVEERFCGRVYFKLYDSKSEITTKGNTGDEPVTYYDWNKEINNGMDSVRSGRFVASMIIPRDINYSDENGRFVFYAYDSDHGMEANGSCEDFYVGGFSDELKSDTIGPYIYMYLNDRDFAEGDAVNNRPVFVAELFDESGIQYSGNGLGHDLQLCIDGDPRMTYNLNDYYNGNEGDYSSGFVYYSDMPELEEGAHSLSLRVWDMLNNTSVKTLRFNVGDNLEPEVLSLFLESDVVSGQTNFHIGYSYPGLQCQFTLEIFSATGAVLWRQEVEAGADSGMVTIPWVGCSSAGASLNSGIYICRVTASYDHGKKSHKEKKFILRRNK